MTDLALTVFVTLFVTIDPVGLAPIFVALTSGIGTEQRNRIALRACAIAIAVLALFGFAGEALLHTIGIGLPAFRIAGGLLLFLIAVDMLFERRAERREKTADNVDTSVDPSVFPLATPLIAGPGALASMILLMGEHPGAPAAQGVIIGTMVLVVASAYILFRLGGVLERVLGTVGTNVVTRLLGMLLAALAVQFVLDGLADTGVLPS
ncbi:MAG: MarC family protein [Pseudomonadota bacterium]